MAEHRYEASGVEYGKGWCSCGWPWRGLEDCLTPGKLYRVTRAEWEAHVASQAEPSPESKGG